MASPASSSEPGAVAPPSAPAGASIIGGRVWPSRGNADALASVAAAITLFAGWAIAAAVIGSDTRLPAPTAVVGSWWADGSLYVENGLPTLRAAAIGFALGAAAAVLVGVALSMLGWAERYVTSTVVTFYNLPIIALAPLVQILFAGEWPRILIAALSVFFIILVGTLAGLRSAPAAAIDVVRAAGGGTLTSLRKVRLVAGAPAMLAAMSASVPLAIVGAMVGEFFGGQSVGLGVMLVSALEDLNATRVWGIGLGVAAVSAVLLAVIDAAVARALPWRAEAPPAALSTAGSGPLRRRAFTALASGALVVVIACLIWVTIVEALGLEPYVVRMPWDVFDYLVLSHEAGANRNALLSALAFTLSHALIGCVVGIVVGTALAALAATVRPLRRAVLTLLVVLSSVPYLALVPVLALALGRGDIMAITLAAIISLLPTVITLDRALSDTNRGIVEVLQAAGAGRARILRHARIPAAVPALFTALRISAPASLVGVLFAEWLASGEGVGGVLVKQATFGPFDGAWSAAVLITACSVLMYAAAGAAERSVARRFAGEAR